MVGKDQDVPCFQHVSEMLYGLVDNQQLSVIGVVYWELVRHILDYLDSAICFRQTHLS